MQQCAPGVRVGERDLVVVEQRGQALHERRVALGVGDRGEDERLVALRQPAEVVVVEQRGQRVDAGAVTAEADHELAHQLPVGLVDLTEVVLVAFEHQQVLRGRVGHTRGLEPHVLLKLLQRLRGGGVELAAPGQLVGRPAGVALLIAPLALAPDVELALQVLHDRTAGLARLEQRRIGAADLLRPGRLRELGGERRSGQHHAADEGVHAGGRRSERRPRVVRLRSAVAPMADQRLDIGMQCVGRGQHDQRVVRRQRWRIERRALFTRRG